MSEKNRALMEGYNRVLREEAHDGEGQQQGDGEQECRRPGREALGAQREFRPDKY